MFADCHAHLDGFLDEEVGEVLSRAHESGVGVVVTVGTTLDSSARAVSLADRFDGLLSGVGVHPMDLPGPLYDEATDRLKALAESSSRVVMVSEIGLDFMEGAPDRAVQYPAFRAQIRLARELGLPIVFHSREAHEETLRVLKEERAYEVGGAMHYFQADFRTAKAAIDMGFYISLARPLLRLEHLQTVAADLSLDDIVLETDAAPQPFKAKRENWTEPRHVKDVAGKLAEIKGVDPADVAAVTTANFLNMLTETGRAAAEETLKSKSPSTGSG